MGLCFVEGSDPFFGLSNRRDKAISRDVAAWLCRQLTSCTVRGLAGEFGLGHADSVRNLPRRVDRALPDSSKIRQKEHSEKQGSGHVEQGDADGLRSELELSIDGRQRQTAADG